MPADCLVEVVRRDRDDTEAKIPHQKKTPEPKGAPQVVLKQASLAQGDLPLNWAQGDLTLQALVRLVPRIDQRLHWVSQAEVCDDQARQQLISKTQGNIDAFALRYMSTGYVRKSTLTGHQRSQSQKSDNPLYQKKMWDTDEILFHDKERSGT